jgi:peptidyl-tRNA hydrolase, PTH1 family
VIVAGLGNPGARYQGTRHNIGFSVVDLIAERWGRPAFKEKFRGEVALVELPGPQAPEKVYLLKPQTFMNLSGESVQPAAAFFKHAPAQVLILHDELDLLLGRVQLKEGGGSGGHNGLKSVTQSLGTADYKRLRLGIGRPPVDFRGSPADFVLQAFAPSEGPQVQDLVSRAADAVELLVHQGVSAAMNQINRRT